MSETADAIGRVIAELRAGDVDTRKGEELFQTMLHFAPDAQVVDATAIYNSITGTEKEYHLYEDHPCIAPPWTNAFICYRNHHGNVVVMHMLSSEFPNGMFAETGKHWETAHNIDWNDVRWAVATTVWCGGSSPAKGVIKPFGPLHMWQFAIAQDGTPLDLHWIDIIGRGPDMSRWDMAHLVLLGTLNFMNCRNVSLVEPLYSRPTRKRLQKLGVRVSTINVFPVGKRYKGKGVATDLGVPLTSVRGHFSEYGMNGKGLLFGRLAGRFWIPQHARGDREIGEVQHNYKVEV